ncbi:MAG: ROK family protein [Oscillibacter sp.]|nr:ROK family protein [Oscillibacter sp.]
MNYLGIDVGGTNVKAGLTDENGRILASASVLSEGISDADMFVALLRDLIRRVLREHGAAAELGGIGVGIPGAVRDGRVLYTCHLPLSDLDLAPALRETFGVPVRLANDADCAAAGEYLCGAGRSSRHFLAVTLGTGIGAGMILNGKLYTGAGFAGEAGHITVRQNGRRCPCSRRGCWEQYASASALARMARDAMRRHPQSRIAAPDAKAVFDAAQEGDETALSLCARYAENIAAGLVSLIDLLHPEIVALGGGVSAAPDELLLNPVRSIAERESYCRRVGLPAPAIVRAELGNDAGVVGAALLHRIVEAE